jgi:hypothetical protein
MVMAPIITLIPGYKSEYFPDLLTCIQAQTVRPEKIIISDDTKYNEFYSLRNSNQYKDICDELNIEVLSGPKNGAMKNINYLIKTSQNSSYLYAHILMDDDIIFPTFYAEHMGMHQENQISCSVSKRLYCLENKIPVHVPRSPRTIDKLQSVTALIDAKLVFHTTLTEVYNWLGELSCMIFSKRFLAQNNLYELDGWSTFGLADLSSVMKASIGAHIGYINSNQSLFRISKNGTTTLRNETYSASIIAWLVMGFIGYRRHYINETALGTISNFVNTVYQKSYTSQCVINSLAEVHLLIRDRKINEAEGVFRNFWSVFLSELHNEA